MDSRGSEVPPEQDDLLVLQGPAAPSSRDAFHPVRARLLERAARHEPTPPLPPETDALTPLVELHGLSVVSHHLEDDSSARLVRAAPRADTTPDAATSPLPPSVLPPAVSRASNEVPRSAPPSSPSASSAAPTESPTLLARTPPPSAVIEELERLRGGGSSGRPPRSERWSPTSAALLFPLLGASIVLSASLFVDKLYEATPEPPPTAPDVIAEAIPAPEVPPEPIRQKVPGPWRIGDAESGRVLRGKIGKEPFLRAIQNAGLPKSEAYRAYTALKGLKDLDRCGASDTFLALLGADKRLTAFEYIVNPEEIYQAKADDTGLLRGSRLDLKVERNQIRRAVVIEGPFEESARRGGFDPGLGRVVEKALSGHKGLSELKRGDRMRVIVQEVTVLGEFSRYAGVEALELTNSNGKVERFYYYSHPIEGGYFDASGRAPWEGGFRKPIPGAPVTSKFNMQRVHPILKKPMPHTGTDFGAPAGTPIGATKPGKVSFIGWGGPSGNLVKVLHDGGYESGYAHLIRAAEGLKVGDSVDRLQTVGYCGSTGRSTGPHLHFTIKKNGEFIDPESLNLDGKRILPTAHREAFEDVRRKYDPILDAIPLPPSLPEIGGPPPAVETGGDDPALLEESSVESADARPPAPSSMASAKAAPPPSPAGAPPAPSAPPSNSPPAKAASPSAPGPQAAPVAPQAIFLTDSELLKMQKAVDPGEVPE